MLDVRKTLLRLFNQIMDIRKIKEGEVNKDNKNIDELTHDLMQEVRLFFGPSR